MMMTARVMVVKVRMWKFMDSRNNQKVDLIIHGIEWDVCMREERTKYPRFRK